MLTVLAVVVLSYLVGSFPTSVVAGKVMRGIDIRAYGSGNAGGTNTFRVLGVKAGIVVSLVDVLKGVFATVVIARLRIDAPLMDGVALQLAAGGAAMVGHVYTLFAGFRGGKGVATGGGMLLVLAPVATTAAAVVFVTTIVATRYVSLGSMLGTATVPIALAVEQYAVGWPVPPVLLWLSLCFPVVVAFTHRSNIRRLVHGNELRIGRQAVSAVPEPASGRA